MLLNLLFRLADQEDPCKRLRSYLELNPNILIGSFLVAILLQGPFPCLKLCILSCFRKPANSINMEHKFNKLYVCMPVYVCMARVSVWSVLRGLTR